MPAELTNDRYARFRRKNMNAQKTGLLIYEMRTRKGLTQKELAEKCNVTDKAV